jgi:biopolymer transport protein ExbB/TolQ
MDDGGDFLTLMWRSSSRLVACSLVMLALMLLRAIVDILERGARYGAAKWQSRSFLKTSASLLEKRDWEGLQAMAESHTWSHVAPVFLSALLEFRKARECLSLEYSAEAAKRGARIAANGVHEQMRKGLSALEAIATTAPLVGLFGTAIGVLDSFRGYVGNKYAYLAFMMTNFADALVPTAAGLLVGVFAMWCFNWRSDKLAVFDTEMKVASLELVKYLEQSGTHEKI